ACSRSPSPCPYSTLCRTEAETRQKRHAHDTAISRSEYLDIIERKTALPMSAGAKVAGLMANARLEHIEAVGDFGINLGMAFQIRSEEHTSELQSPDHLVC